MSGPPDLARLAPLLVPAPRRLELLPGPPVAVDRPRFALAPGYGREGYRLTVGGDPDGGETVAIEAGEQAGLVRGGATLAQLHHQYGARLPRLVIEDAPAIERRGWMLDVSRDRVPTAARLDELVEVLALLKLDEFELYTEHTFAYDGHEAVWRDASPITPDELRTLDRTAARHGLRLVANQNCFGHFERWLRHPAYAPLAETHGRFLFEGLELEGPFSLCPTDPRSLELVRDLLDQLLPCVSGGAVHLGCDETQDVGQGRSAGAVAERGAFEVYAEYVGAVAEHVVGHGFEPRFWADIALRHPARVGELHAGLVPVAWGYEPDHPFEDQAAALAATGRPFHLACGSSAWRSFTGRTAERRDNLERCLAAARTHGARGVLLTEWGDLGHRQVPALGRLALAEFAGRSWNPAVEVDPRAVALQVFGDRRLAVADWIAELGDVDRDLRRASCLRRADGRPGPLTNATALFESLHRSGFPFELPADPAPWRAVAERLEDLRRRRPSVDAALDRELSHACDQAALALELALAARGNGGPRRARRIASLADRVREEQRALWLADSRPGGLEDSLAHWDRALGSRPPGP